MNRWLAALWFAGVIVGEALVGSSVSAASERVRVLITLTDEADLEALERLEAMLKEGHGVGSSSRLTVGAVLGLVVDLEPSSLTAVRAEEGVRSVVPVEEPPPHDGVIPPDKFARHLGATIPGLYIVLLNDTFGYEGDVIPTGKTWNTPGRDQRLARQRAAIDGVVRDLVARSGCRIAEGYAAIHPSFRCAMKEAAARRIAHDPRVRGVAEVPYVAPEPAAPSFIQ